MDDDGCCTTCGADTGVVDAVLMFKKDWLIRENEIGRLHAENERLRARIVVLEERVYDLDDVNEFGREKAQLEIRNRRSRG
jgi:cell division protein FtsB